MTTLLARETDNTCFHQGMIVLPLHDLVNIVESWATADIIRAGALICLLEVVGTFGCMSKNHIISLNEMSVCMI